MGVGIGVCVDVIRVDTDDVGIGVDAIEVGDVDNVAFKCRCTVFAWMIRM